MLAQGRVEEKGKNEYSNREMERERVERSDGAGKDSEREKEKMNIAIER